MSTIEPQNHRPKHFAKDSSQLRRHKLRKRDTSTATVQPWVVVCITQGVQYEHLKWMSLFMSLIDILID